MTTGVPAPSFVVPPVAGKGRSALALSVEAIRRPGGRRALSVLTVVLLVAGVALFAYPLATNVYQGFVQRHLRSTFASDPKISTEYQDHTVPVGDGLTELKIPSIGVDVLVVEGTTPSALRAGAGHYVGTPLPGEAGNVSIAGHRTTFGRPFNRLDEVKVGQLATLQTPFAVYTYKVVPVSQFVDSTGAAEPSNPTPVDPTDTDVIQQPTQLPTTEHLLTLTTCNPKGSAAQRLILRLTLVKSVALPNKTIPAGTNPGDSGSPAQLNLGTVTGGD